MVGSDFTIDGAAIRCGIFECEKDRLPFADESFGTLLFCDCLEHLIVDPVWTILEFNRVLKREGHLIINTPNAAAVSRILAILRGENPASENVIKPMSIYQRHNREWTLDEIAKLVRCCGFIPVCYSTSSSLITDEEHALLRTSRERGNTALSSDVFGPELFVVAEKASTATLDSPLPLDERWPTWLYSAHAAYRRRPKFFPIVVSDDY
jgi:hypothetical protein